MDSVWLYDELSVVGVRVRVGAPVSELVNILNFVFVPYSPCVPVLEIDPSVFLGLIPP